MKKIAIYARVSTTDQNVESQLMELREYCQSREFKIHHEYVDNGISGIKESRPELNKLMKDAKRRLFDVLLVWRFDRFARSTQHLVTALTEFQSLGVDFISLQESIDTSSPMGKFAFTVFAAISEFERSLIQERVRMGLRNARARGIKLGRKKTQYDLDKILQLRTSGLSIRKIALDQKLSVGKVHSIIKANS